MNTEATKGATHMSETAAAPEAAETQPNPYEIVRVSGPNGHESLRRVLVEGLKDYTILEGEPAVDGFGYPLPSKPRTDLAGQPTARPASEPSETEQPAEAKAVSAKTRTTKEI